MNYQLLKEKRIEMGKTQQDVAYESGLTLPTIYRLETGKSISPKYETITAMCKYYGISVEELMGDNSTSN